VERAEGERSGEIRRRDEKGAVSDRLESRIDPEVRRQLEAIRRGDAGGPNPPAPRGGRLP
jgi:hypothetical protein